MRLFVLLALAGIFAPLLAVPMTVVGQDVPVATEPVTETPTPVPAEPPAPTEPPAPEPSPTAAPPTVEPTVEPTGVPAETPPVPTSDPEISPTPLPTPTAKQDDADEEASSPVAVSLAAISAPVLSLTITPDALHAGEQAIAAATLSGATATVTGTVTYSLYANKPCVKPVDPPWSSTKGLAGGVVPPTSSVPFNDVGTFYWRAVYSGDANNSGAVSPCLPITVSKAEPALTLTFDPDPVEIGKPVTALGQLKGAAPAAGGTITYRVYANQTDCARSSRVISESSQPVAGAIAQPAEPLQFDSFDTRYWRADYSGDAANTPASTGCLAVPVVKARPVLLLTVTPSPVPVNRPATAAAMLTGASGTPGGSVTYALYQDDTCATPLQPVQSSTRTIAGGQIPDSAPFTIKRSGRSYWQARYSGDDRNSAVSSACVAVTVTRATPLLTLTQQPSPVDPGAQFSVRVFLGEAATPTGTVTIRGFADTGCAVPLANRPPDQLPLVDSQVAASPAVTFTAGDTRSFQGTYSGDANNAGGTTACQAVALTAVRDLSLAVVLSQASPVRSGVPVSAIAGWPVEETPTGQIGYTLLTGAACTGTAIAATEMVTISAGAAAAASPFQLTQAGDYSWLVSFAGDDRYRPATACASFRVQAAAALSLEALPATPAVGSAFVLRAVLSGDTGAASGSVLYALYTDDGCTVPVAGVPAGAATLVNGSATTPPLALTAAGTFYGQATYAGDPYHTPAVSPCLAIQSVGGALTASIVSASLSDVTYSGQAGRSTGQIVVVVNDLRGTQGGWSVTITSSDVVYSGPAAATGIPAAGFTITSAGQPVVLSGQPIGAGGPVASLSALGRLSDIRVIARADPGAGAGAYQQTLGIALVIPPFSPVGTYTATLIVSTVSGR